jgi:hypothetical protein
MIGKDKTHGLIGKIREHQDEVNRNKKEEKAQLAAKCEGGAHHQGTE